ncbi:MAG: serine/threonine-protein kinase [Thermodesulfobacteriota bacterium]|nr:serine/threonine-protein kinase [Thermodesulfobacteriota bacterium]
MSEIIQSGSILGGYEIERELGRGGMGVVYKAHELSLNRKVAVKVLSRKLSTDEEFIKRFKREAQVIASLNHPNIVNILSYGEEHDLYYFAMEYITGQDLGQILQDKTSIPLDEALSITSQVASALAEAGTKGVVHRDLKPSNIMIDSIGRAKVTDFGVAHFEDSDAKLTRTGLFLGTPEYASPEQATGKQLDVRSDIYALGAVLYRMLSGKPPITGESPLAVVTKIATEPVPPIGEINPALPKPVCNLIDKMMAKDPHERFQTPHELISSIDACVSELKIDAPLTKSTIHDRGKALPSQSQQKSRAKLVGSIVGVALAILLIVWIVEGGLLKEKSPPEPPKTVETSAKPVLETKRGDSLSDSDVERFTEKESDMSAKKDVTPAVMSKVPVLPKSPTVLMVVSGEEAMALLVRSHLESIMLKNGLKLTAVSEIPVLREKMQFGEIPLSWYSIKQYVPSDKAHILLVAQVQKTGSVPLKFFGRTQELTTATYSIRAVDIVTGTSIAVPASGSVEFTPLNMEENFREAITSDASGMGPEIKKYWKEKLKEVAKKN